MYFSHPNIINPLYIQYLREMFPPSNQNIVLFCNQITLLILYYPSPKQVTQIKVTDNFIQVSHILDLTVCFKFNNFSFQIFLLFVLVMSTGFTFTLFRLMTLLWFGYCNHCILARFLWSKSHEHSSSNHGLCCFNSYRHRLFSSCFDILFDVFPSTVYVLTIIKILQRCKPV